MRQHRGATDMGGVALGLIITPMLDMSFQILSFFIMTYHPSALEGHINGNLVPPTKAKIKGTESNKVEDNLLPERTVCLGCHKEAEIGAPRTTLVSKFSHQQHLKMGNIAPLLASAILKKTYLSPADGISARLNTKNACVACHRGLEESDARAKAAYPQMADCLVCHTKIEPPFSCRTCHAETAQLRPASHTPDLIDTHSSGKLQFDKQSCAVCHGRKFLCLGCHQ